jgi:hypothetical protein
MFAFKIGSGEQIVPSQISKKRSRINITVSIGINDPRLTLGRSYVFAVKQDCITVQHYRENITLYILLFIFFYLWFQLRLQLVPEIRSCNP